MSNKRIKPEDEVTITTTYGDLALIYALLGPTNGKTFGKEHPWSIAKNLLGDIYQNKYEEFFMSGDVDRYDKYGIKHINYVSWQDKWINHLFQQETEQEKKIRELEETISKATKQIEELKGLNQ